MAKHQDGYWGSNAEAALSHFRPASPLAHHPDSRRGQGGTMPMGQTKKLSGAFAGIPSTTGSSDIGPASGGPAQAAVGAGGYSAMGGGAASSAPAPSAPSASSAPAPSGASAAGVPTTSVTQGRVENPVAAVPGSSISAPPGYTGSPSISAPAGYTGSTLGTLITAPGGGSGGSRNAIPL